MRGQSYGFDLQFLRKLATIKAGNIALGKSTLIHFVVSISEATNPGIVEALSHELDSIHEASSTSLVHVVSEIRKLRSRVDKVRREFETGSGALAQELSEPFRKKIEPFLPHW